MAGDAVRAGAAVSALGLPAARGKASGCGEDATSGFGSELAAWSSGSGQPRSGRPDKVEPVKRAAGRDGPVKAQGPDQPGQKDEALAPERDGAEATESEPTLADAPASGLAAVTVTVPGAEGAAWLAQAMLLPRGGHASVAASAEATAASAAGLAITLSHGAAGTSDAARLASSATQEPLVQDPAPTGEASAPPLLAHREKADKAGKAAESRTVVQTLAAADDRRTPLVSASDAPKPSWQDRAQAHMPARAQAQRPSEVEVRAQALPQQPATQLAADAASAEAAAQAMLSLSPLPARRVERGEDRSLAWSAGSLAHEAGSALASVQAAPSPFMPAVDAAMAATAFANPLTEQLMEQVSWYLSQKTQGAQLTLDVPGGLPVSVSIQVQGNEAQIAFRSDQPEARQLLTQSLPHLKDMLGAEGLMLSGATVDSGQGRREEPASGGPPRAPVGAFGNGISLEPSAAPARQVAAGRLDLYV
jgi:flagellar hook-length control protein FliK